MKKKCLKTKKGFTLVELSLAVAFISLILLIMATLTTSLIAIYRKGVTINAVNSVGRSIVEDFQNAIAEADQSQSPEYLCSKVYPVKTSTGYNNCLTDKARKLFYYEYSNSSHTPESGVFCTGSYSYVWNTPNATGHKMKINGTDDFRLYKVPDRNRDACAKLLNNNYANNNTTNLGVGWTDASELISKSDTNLAIYHIYVAPVAMNLETSNVFYSGSFILATKEGGVNIMASGDYCKPPGDSSADKEKFNYCAINKFNFAVQGNGG